MGIFCMLLGVVVFLGMGGGGYLLADTIAKLLKVLPGKELAFGQTWGGFLKLPETGIIVDAKFYIIVCGVCAFIGLLIGLSLFMNGLMYRKICKLKRRRSRRED